MTTTQKGSAEAAAVTVRVFGALRQAIGQSEVKVPCAGDTVKDVLRRLSADRNGEVEHYIFDKQGNVWHSLLLLVNDEPVDNVLQQTTSPGDVICLLLPVAGG